MTENVPATKPGTWVKGQSGNPAGRPKGKKNEITELQQDLELAVRKNINSAKVVQIVEKVVEMAVQGNLMAAKLILDKVMPNAKPAEDSAGDNRGFTIRIENATLVAERHENVIDITPTEVNDEHRS